MPASGARAGPPGTPRRRRRRPDHRPPRRAPRASAHAGADRGRPRACDLAGDRDGHLPPPPRRRLGVRPADDLVALLTPIVKAACTDNGAEAAEPRRSACTAATGTSPSRASSSSPATRASARSTRAPTASRRSTWSAASWRCTRAGWRAASFTWSMPSSRPSTRPKLGEFVAGLPRRVRPPAGHDYLAGRKRPGDREQAAAAATDYLRLFALTAFASLWLRMAEACLGHRRGVTPEFRETKLATGRFFVRRILPETAALGRDRAVGKGNRSPPSASDERRAMIYDSPTPPIEIPDVTLHDWCWPTPPRAAIGRRWSTRPRGTRSPTPSWTCSTRRHGRRPAGARARAGAGGRYLCPQRARVSGRVLRRRPRRGHQHHHQRPLHRAASWPSSCATPGARFLFTTRPDARPRPAGCGRGRGRGGVHARRRGDGDAVPLAADAG